MGRETSLRAGYGRSDKQEFVIANGADGSTVDPVDLERNYAFHVVRCLDCQYIQAGTTLGIEAGMDDSDTLADLSEQDDPSTPLAMDLPTSGSFQTLVTHGLGAQRLRLVLSQVASGGGVTFEVYGLDQSVG